MTNPSPDTSAMSETIIAAALRYQGIIMVLMPPARHHTIIQKMDNCFGCGPEVGGDEQGFLTSAGRFVGRIEARDIAVQNMGAKPDHRSELFSEDLW